MKDSVRNTVWNIVIWDLKAVDIGRAKDGEESRREAQASEASIDCQEQFLEIQEQQHREIIMISLTRSSVFLNFLLYLAYSVYFSLHPLLHPLPHLKLEW